MGKKYAKRNSIVQVVLRYFLLTFVLLCTALVFMQLTLDINSAQSDLNDMFLPFISQGPVHIQSEDLLKIRWQEADGPANLTFAEAVTVKLGENNEYLYVIGGGNGSASRSNFVSHAKILADGSLGKWSTVDADPQLEIALNGHTVVAAGNLLYVVGGEKNNAGSQWSGLSGNVFCAELNTQDGSFRHDWITNSSLLPAEVGFDAPVAFHASVVSGQHIYLLGGYRKVSGGQWVNTNQVWSAKVGSNCNEPLFWRKEAYLGANSTTALVDYHVTNLSAVAIKSDNKSWVLAIGGGNNSGVNGHVFAAEITLDGRINSWQMLPDFDSHGLQLLTAVQTGSYLYLLGGSAHPVYNCYASVNTVYRAEIIAADPHILGPWNLVGDLPKPLYGHAAVNSSLGHLYVIGGTENSIQNSTKNNCRFAPQKDNLNSTVSDKIYWTPLLFFHKESNPPDVVIPGEEIQYRFTITSNNVRDLSDLVISDTLPSNVELLYAPNFSLTGRLLKSQPISLPINHMTWQSFTAVVHEPTAVSPNNLLPVATPQPGQQAAPVSQTAVQELQSTIRPTQTKGCVILEAQINSGTPRPKPTCTPTPPVTVSVTPTSSTTATPTETASPTVTLSPSDTPTPTALPEPVLVVNQAELCIAEACVAQDTAVTAPFRIYLPLITQ